MTAPTGRRMTKGERTRERIIDAAADLFAGQGFRAVSLRDIAAHAGLTHAGLLHHFASKDEVLVRVLEHRDAIDAVLLFDERIDAPRHLAEIVGFVARNMRTPGLVELYVKISGEATAPDHPAHRYFRHRYQVLRDVLARLLTEIADGPAGATLRYQPRVAAQQLIALMDGLQTQWLFDRDAVDMRGSVVAYLTSIGIDTSEFAESPAPAADASTPTGRTGPR